MRFYKELDTFADILIELVTWNGHNCILCTQNVYFYKNNLIMKLNKAYGSLILTGGFQHWFESFFKPATGFWDHFQICNPTLCRHHNYIKNLSIFKKLATIPCLMTASDDTSTSSSLLSLLRDLRFVEEFLSELTFLEFF